MYKFQNLTSKWIPTQGSKRVRKFSLTHKVNYFLVKWLCSKSNKMPWSFSWFHTIQHKWKIKDNKTELKQGLLVSGSYSKQWKFPHLWLWSKVIQRWTCITKEWIEWYLCKLQVSYACYVLESILNMYLDNVSKSSAHIITIQMQVETFKLEMITQYFFKSFKNKLWG